MSHLSWKEQLCNVIDFDTAGAKTGEVAVCVSAAKTCPCGQNADVCPGEARGGEELEQHPVTWGGTQRHARNLRTLTHRCTERA